MDKIDFDFDFWFNIGINSAESYGYALDSSIYPYYHDMTRYIVFKVHKSIYTYHNPASHQLVLSISSGVVSTTDMGMDNVWIDKNVPQCHCVGLMSHETVMRTNTIQGSHIDESQAPLLLPTTSELGTDSKRSRRWINWAATIPIRERHRKWFIPVISTNHMRRNQRQVVSRNVNSLETSDNVSGF